MKIATIVFIIGLVAFPVIGLAQTPEIPVSSTQPVATTTAPQSAVVFPPKEIETSTRCGVYSYKFYNECGVGLYLYKNVYAQCFDGFEVTLGGETSCETYETWTQSANDACANHCDAPQSLQKPIIPATPETAVPAPTPESTTPTTTTFGGNTGGGGGVISTTPITPTVTPQTTAVSPPQTKCGVNSSAVSNECGAGAYKNIYAQCYDGFEVILGEETSCKPAELWNQYAKEACVNHCSKGDGSGVVSAPVIYAGDNVEGGNRSAPLVPLTPMPEVREWISVCYISDKLMQQYNELILELQRVSSDKIKAEEITRQIVALKQYIEAQKKACIDNPQTAWQVAAPPIATENKPIATTENKPVAVPIDRCTEVVQWENKIAYYKKLGNLGDDDLKKEGFSREEIENIVHELLSGIEKVRVQCNGQEKTPIMPRITAITGLESIAETVKPVVAESGQEISVYYKAKIEKAVSIKGEEKQIEELKTLRDEIDGLISNLIKSRKELEVSELNTLVKEVKVSRGEIKADDISVKTTEKKILVNVGTRPVSVEPTASQVLIRDKGLEVNTNEVTIKENILSVGGVDVKMSASEVTEILGLTPKIIELKEENDKAVYNMTIEERRKLFGLIPFNSQKTITADADNGNTLSEQLPWYNFLTTK